MRILKINILFCLLTLGACYGINEKTSKICSIRTSCPDNSWDSIFSKYNTNRIKDSTFIDKISEFKRMPFAADLVYFDKGPKEIIGISEDRYAIRYVFNPNLSNKVLCGLDKELSEKETKRIERRVHKLLAKYGCKNY